jgi:hypothetical protein
MFGLFRRRGADAPRGDETAAPARRIDPAAIFPDDGRWDDGPPEGPAVWRVATPRGVFFADAHAVEVVEGALLLLDAEDNVLGVLDPGQWDAVACHRPGAAAAAEIPAGGAPAPEAPRDAA